MDILLSFAIAVLASVASHYVIKWLDSGDNKK